VSAKILPDGAVAGFDVACKHPKCGYSFCLRAGRNIARHLRNDCEVHSASSSSISFVTVELNSDTEVWSVTYSVSHAVQRTTVSRISQVWLPQLQVYRSAIKHLLQKSDALHHRQEPTQNMERPAVLYRSTGMRFHSADGARRANAWDLERHTSPFEVELTNRLRGATERRGQVQEFLFAAAGFRRTVSSRYPLA